MEALQRMYVHKSIKNKDYKDNFSHIIAERCLKIHFSNCVKTNQRHGQERPNASIVLWFPLKSLSVPKGIAVQGHAHKTKSTKIDLLNNYYGQKMFVKQAKNVNDFCHPEVFPSENVHHDALDVG